MHNYAGSRSLKVTIGLSFAAALFFVAAPADQARPQQAVTAPVRLAEQQYKNIKVLNGLPAEQVVQAMHVMSGSLGVECEYCHDEVDRAKDDKKPKVVARRMMTMMMNINKTSFEGKQVVTCYTCHRGSPEPVKTQPLPVNLAVLDEDAKPGPALPSVDDILTKYVQALGGEQAIRKITSRVITATQDLPTGAGGVTPVPAKVEQDTKAPNLSVNMSKTDKISVADGFDGTTAWAQNAAGVVASPNNPAPMRVRRDANFYESLDLKNEYPDLKVVRAEKVNGRDAYMLEGTPNGDSPERLYFDAQTGFLLRKENYIATAAGNHPFEVDYDDYRNAGHGVKIPFVIRMFAATPESHLQTHTTIHVQKVQENVAIEDAKFVKPASKPAPPPAPAPGK